ncbi:unnamed protein product [Clonostachys rhizophaga]|uniref:CFEM domain-containing protein n=1 Tax=Clonostachys rhizophaga TaxID=160324 RepID=A0A9N9VXV5_9HYPO|nr:unnamed protein product [Clonostachys rhizophaga]
MARLRALVATLVLFLAFPHNVRGDNNASAELTKLPSCGLDCFTATVPNTTCSPADLSCVCTDSTFQPLASQCVQSRCTVREAFEIKKIEDEACDRPTRSRKGILLIPLAAEIPAWACPWVHLYSRLTTSNRLEVDDWITIIVGVCGYSFAFTPSNRVNRKLTNCLGSIQRIHGARTIRYVDYSAEYLLICGTAFANTIGTLVGQRSFGVDIWTLDPDALTMSFKLFYVNESLYVVTLCLCKVSILFLYLRMFPSQQFRSAVYGALLLTILPTFVIMFLQIFQCIPIAYIWEGWQKPDYVGYCLNLNHLAFISAGFSIVQDLVILILPLPSLFQLTINIRDKIGLVFIFSLGLFATAISCLRTLYIIKFDRSNTNPTWEYVDLIVWTGLEVAVAVIVACLPAIWVLLKRYVPWLSGSDRSGYIKTPSRTDVDSVGTRRPITKGDIRHMVMLHDNHDGEEDGARAELAPPPSAAHPAKKIRKLPDFGLWYFGYESAKEHRYEHNWVGFIEPLRNQSFLRA